MWKVTTFSTWVLNCSSMHLACWRTLIKRQYSKRVLWPWQRNIKHPLLCLKLKVKTSTQHPTQQLHRCCKRKVHITSSLLQVSMERWQIWTRPYLPPHDHHCQVSSPPSVTEDSEIHTSILHYIKQVSKITIVMVMRTQWRYDGVYCIYKWIIWVSRLLREVE